MHDQMEMQLQNSQFVVGDNLNKALAQKGDSFICVLVKQLHFNDNPVCLHCGDRDQFSTYTNFVEDQGAVVGDIRICDSCHNPTIVLLYPILAVGKPVFFKWRMKP